MKTSELTGAALDWAVATCEGAYTPSVDTDVDGTKRVNYGGMYPEWSTDWSQGGPIIEREGMQIYRIDQSFWGTTIWWDDEHGASEFTQKGPTPLIAAMRCYVASKLGDNVDIPKELMQ